MVSCIKVNDVGRTCTIDKDADGYPTGTETCSGENKYMCNSIDTEYESSTEGSGRIERFGSDVPEWQLDDPWDNNTRQSWCVQRFVLTEDGTMHLGDPDPLANCEDSIIDKADIIMTDSEMSYKITYLDNNGGFYYSEDASLAQYEAMNTALKNTELYV